MTLTSCVYIPVYDTALQKHTCTIKVPIDHVFFKYRVVTTQDVLDYDMQNMTVSMS